MKSLRNSNTARHRVTKLQNPYYFFQNNITQKKEDGTLLQEAEL